MAFDWRIYVRAGAAIGWTPNQVGECGLSEFHEALRGWADAHGGGKAHKKMSRSEILEMRAQIWGEHG